MPRRAGPHRRTASASLSPEGRLFRDYYDLEALKQHLEDLSPRDSKVIDEYVTAIRSLLGRDFMGEMMMGSAGGKLRGAACVLAS